MPYNLDDYAPYSSVTLFRNIVGDNISIDTTVAEIKKIVAKKDADGVPLVTNRKIVEVIPSDSNTIIHYYEKKPPTWYLGDEKVLDHTHNIIVVSVSESLLGLTFTDKAMRNRLVAYVSGSDEPAFLNVKPLKISEMEQIFVDKKIRTLWLTGAHRRSLIKPDAKVISGIELESALDPLGDQSYFFSSVRSTFSDGGFMIDDKPTVLGTSPKQSRVWIGPNRTWEDFKDRIELILGHTNTMFDAGLDRDPPIPVLAHSTNELSDLGQAYGISLIVPEQIMPDVSFDADDKWFQLFSDTAIFEITPTQNNSTFRTLVSWGDEVFGHLNYSLSTTDSGKVKLSCEKDGWLDDDQANEIFEILNKPDHVTIYFDSGHTYSRGRMIKTQFRDARFKDWKWIPIDTQITAIKKEKPLDGRRFAIEQIGEPTDVSLFGLMARHYPNLETMGAQTGWLVCDDGSMESADFIYFDDTPGQEVLELIHVKGSGSDSAGRGVSVTDYEIVVGQAIKNLRHIDQNSLLEKLRANMNNQIGTAVWKDGVRQPNRDGFLAALEQVTTDLEKTVIVFQPRVRKSVRQQIMDQGHENSASRRLRQLDALLLGARNSCFSLGARFLVISENA